MTSRVPLIFVLSLMASSCTMSKGFHRDALRSELNDKVEVTEAEISKALSLRPQLPYPFTLGIFFKEPDGQAQWRNPAWHWTDEDKEKVFSTARKLEESGRVSKVFLINASVVSGTDLKSIRLAAAQHGADALLVVSGASDTDSYHTSWSWTYVALATMLFVPANKVDALFMSHAALWDVRNQYLYMTAEAEGIKSQTRPAASIDERKTLMEAKEESLGKLNLELSKMAGDLSREKLDEAVSDEGQPRNRPKTFESKTLNKSVTVPISM